LFLAACGSESANPISSRPNSKITGVAAAGVIKGGTVKAFAPYSSLTGADKKQVGNTTTTSQANGSYTLDIGTYSGPVVVEVTGGSYVDEASNQSVTNTALLRAAVPASGAIVSLPITPLTELAVQLAHRADARLGNAAITAANAHVSDLFKVNIISATPLDASTSITGGTQVEQDYTVALATISQLAGVPAALATTLTNLADNIAANGAFDATTAGNIVAARDAFLASANNKTGVTQPSTAMQKITETTVKLTLILSDSGVRGIQADMLLPVGISADTSPTNGSLIDASVFIKPVGSSLTAINVGYSAPTTSPGTAALFLAATGADIGPGEFLTIAFQLAAGNSVPTATDFALTNVNITDGKGVTVNGATLSAKVSLSSPKAVAY